MLIKGKSKREEKEVKLKVLGATAFSLMLSLFLISCGATEDDSIEPDTVNAQALISTEYVSEVSDVDSSVSNASEAKSFEDDPWNKVYQLDMPSLYSQITEVNDAENFEGSWEATNCLSAVSGSLNITNQTSKGFHVEGDFLYGYRTGTLSGEAYFVSPNMAICSQNDIEDSTSDGYMVLYLENDSLYVNSDPGVGSMGMSVSPNNEYTKGEPVYKNDDNLNKTFTQEELDNILKLVGDEVYKYPFLECTNNFIVDSSEKALDSGVSCKYVQCYFSDMPENYTAILASDGRIYIELHSYSEDYFFTNDSDWTSNKMPEVK